MDYIDRFIDKLDEEGLDKLQDKLLDKNSLEDYGDRKDKDSEISIISDYIEPAMERIKNWGKLQGLSTGYWGLDEMTGGLNGGELIILAGQTSHGKSQLAANISYNVAKAGKPVLFVTLEMTKPETTSRFMKLYQYDHTNDDGSGVGELPIMYQLKNELNYKDIGMLMQKAKEFDCGLVVIDHLHYFPRGTGDNIRNEIGRITKHFKECAIAYDLPVVLLSHVRRLEQTKKKPDLSDLKESGYIEQDADIVLMIWRDLSEDSATTNEVEVSILKNRNRGFGMFRKMEYHVPSDNGVKLIEGREAVETPFN